MKSFHTRLLFAGLVCGLLSVAAQAQNDEPKKSEAFTFTEKVMVNMKSLTVYDIEVKSDKQFTLRLTSPSSVKDAAKSIPGNLAFSSTKDANGYSYSGTVRNFLEGNQLAGDWLLEISFTVKSRAANDFPSGFSYKVNTGYTR